MKRPFEARRGTRVGRTSARAAVVVSLLWLATACGGGGGASPGPADDLNLVGTHIAPPDGGTDVALDVVPTFYSDVATIDCATVSSLTFTLAMDPGPAVTGAVACSDHSVTFTPNAPLATSTRYVVYVPAMKDTGSKYLCKNTAWRFTTRAPPPPPAPRNVGGTVSGLTGTGLVLRNNGGDDEVVTGNGGFTFATQVLDGASYAVTVRTQPTGQRCTVTNGAGTVSGHDVGDVAVSCAARSTTPIAYVYVPNAANGGPATAPVPVTHSITPFAMDETGALTALPQGPVDTVWAPDQLAVDPTGKHLYAAAQFAGVRHYTIGADGSLTLHSVTRPHRPWVAGISIDPTGTYAYVTSWATAEGKYSEVNRYTFDPDGGLVTVASGMVVDGTVAETGGGSLLTVLGPTGAHAYTAGSFTNPNDNTTTRRIVHWTIAGDGNWTVDATHVFYLNYTAMLPVLDPSGRFAYFDGNLHDRYTVEAAGHLTPAGTWDAGAGFATLTIHPSGDHAYAVRSSDANVVQFTVGADGALTSQGSFGTFSSPSAIGGVHVDPSGRFAYVSLVPNGYGARALAQYDVDDRGKLTPMATPRVFGLDGWPWGVPAFAPAP